jgi:hypothetical protein
LKLRTLLRQPIVPATSAFWRVRAPTRIGDNAVVVGTGASVAWVAAENGYHLALDGTTLICRNPRGSLLKSVPAAVRKGPAAERMIEVRDWLVRHERECRATVETWMLRSLPVPRSVIAEVWPDPSWSSALRDLVVVGRDAAGREVTGLLRSADVNGLGVVTLDGETRQLTTDAIDIPHPVLLSELADAREFVVELGTSQVVPQLFRETFARPADVEPGTASFDTWAGARFKELRHATSRCATLGFRVSGGFATIRVWEGGVPVEARFWVGSDEPSMEAETGPLVFMDVQSRTLTLGEIGPVAWSEGARMAQLVAAGGVKDGDDEDVES